MSELYPFPRDIAGTCTFTKMEIFLAKLFGKKYHEYDGVYEIIAYHYKGKIYITKLGKLYE
jgi:hypothetical protein